MCVKEYFKRPAAVTAQLPSTCSSINPPESKANWTKRRVLLPTIAGLEIRKKIGQKNYV